MVVLVFVRLSVSGDVLVLSRCSLSCVERARFETVIEDSPPKTYQSARLASVSCKS